MNQNADSSNRELTHLEELCIDEALGFLSEDEASELHRLRNQLGVVSDESYERTAALATLAAPLDEELPPHLHERLLRTGEQQLRQRTARASLPTLRALPPRPRSRWVGWIAAAACLAIALVGWWPRLLQGPTDWPAARAELIGTNAAVQWEWTVTGDPAAEGARGDVVWNSEKQEGYLRLEGIAPNDPAVNQYQLWIFDAAQDERFPVDGGVFDVGDEGEIIIPIRPKIEVENAQMFAVTVEKPGGVVVSDRSRIVVLARADSG